MIRILPRIILLLVLSLILVSWGNVGHKIINSKSTDSFPASMSSFKIWSDSLSQHSSDADNRKNSDPNEDVRHFIDIEYYAEFNTTGRIALTFDSVATLHGISFVNYNGTLPWATLNTYDSLKVAFRQLKWHKAMLLASDLGHYVGDGHMPLHISSNYDGQLTGQKGIHSRYESTMVARYQTQLANYSGDSVHFVSNVNQYIFDYIYVDHHYVDSLLAADTYAKQQAGGVTNTTTYTDALWSKTNFTKLLFHNSSHSLAELIYSAWIEAGSPVFGSTSATSEIPATLVNDISVFPNPASGVLNIIGDNVLKTEVNTLTGTLAGIYYNQQFDIRNLNNGMYILSIYGKDRLLKKEKLLICK